MLRLPELGCAIRDARITRGLTEEALARAAGVSRLTLNRLENGVFPDLGIKKVGVILDYRRTYDECVELVRTALTNVADERQSPAS